VPQRRSRAFNDSGRRRHLTPRRTGAGLECILQAGAQPISWVSLACELERNWSGTDTVADVVNIILTSRLLKGI
jgi:hypothetical protein